MAVISFKDDVFNTECTIWLEWLELIFLTSNKVEKNSVTSQYNMKTEIVQFSND
jgi:hypothetical protein